MFFFYNILNFYSICWDFFRNTNYIFFLLLPIFIMFSTFFYTFVLFYLVLCNFLWPYALILFSAAISSFISISGMPFISVWFIVIIYFLSQFCQVNLCLFLFFIYVSLLSVSLFNLSCLPQHFLFSILLLKKKFHLFFNLFYFPHGPGGSYC